MHALKFADISTSCVDFVHCNKLICDLQLLELSGVFPLTLLMPTLIRPLGPTADLVKRMQTAQNGNPSLTTTVTLFFTGVSQPTDKVKYQHFGQQSKNCRSLKTVCPHCSGSHDYYRNAPCSEVRQLWRIPQRGLSQMHQIY
jgi:hypothetical protein